MRAVKLILAAAAIELVLQGMILRLLASGCLFEEQGMPCRLAGNLV
jgi:hypothetical protein